MSDYKNPIVKADDEFEEISFRLSEPLNAALRAEATSKGQSFGDYYLYLIAEEYELHYHQYFEYIKIPEFQIKSGALRLEDLPSFGLDEGVYRDLMIAPSGKHPIHMRNVPVDYIKVAQLIRTGLGFLHKSDDWIFRFLSQKIAMRKLLAEIRKIIG